MPTIGLGAGAVGTMAHAIIHGTWLVLHGARVLPLGGFAHTNSEYLCDVRVSKFNQVGSHGDSGSRLSPLLCVCVCVYVYVRVHTIYMYVYICVAQNHTCM